VLQGQRWPPSWRILAAARAFVQNLRRAALPVTRAQQVD